MNIIRKGQIEIVTNCLFDTRRPRRPLHAAGCASALSWDVYPSEADPDIVASSLPLISTIPGCCSMPSAPLPHICIDGWPLSRERRYI
jgi:hypothetical protein